MNNDGPLSHEFPSLDYFQSTVQLTVKISLTKLERLEER
jgi:hypothetical protein